jgi:hypothetical protein
MEAGIVGRSSVAGAAAFALASAFSIAARCSGLSVEIWSSVTSIFSEVVVAGALPALPATVPAAPRPGGGINTAPGGTVAPLGRVIVVEFGTTVTVVESGTTVTVVEFGMTVPRLGMGRPASGRTSFAAA